MSYYLRRWVLSALAIGLTLPLYLYARSVVGSKIDTVRWLMLTACFWLGIVILIAAQRKRGP